MILAAALVLGLSGDGLRELLERSPELLERAQELLFRTGPGDLARVAVVLPPHSEAAIESALKGNRTGPLAQRATEAGIPVRLFVTRTSGGRTVSEEAIVASRRIGPGQWTEFRDARARVKAAYLRWIVEDPSATYTIGIGLLAGPGVPR